METGETMMDKIINAVLYLCFLFTACFITALFCWFLTYEPEDTAFQKKVDISCRLIVLWNYSLCAKSNSINGEPRNNKEKIITALQLKTALNAVLSELKCKIQMILTISPYGLQLKDKGAPNDKEDIMWINDAGWILFVYDALKSIADLIGRLFS